MSTDPSQTDDLVLLDAPPSSSDATSVIPQSTAEDPLSSSQSQTQTQSGNIAPSKHFTPSERIQQLNKIDKDIASLLSSAGLAIQSLSSPSNDQKQIFTEHTKQFHSLLSSIVVNIRRQIFALEQADIQIPGSVGWNTVGGPAGNSSTSGGIDVGAITGRGDTVGRTMEAKLWREAREFVEELEKGGLAGGGSKEAGEGGGDRGGGGGEESMQVDEKETEKA